jgi:hypothetical protein
LCVLEPLVVGAALGGRHSPAFDFVLPSRLKHDDQRPGLQKPLNMRRI